jgi:RNA polymerase sigma-70 factor (ECF subfamily)
MCPGVLDLPDDRDSTTWSTVRAAGDKNSPEHECALNRLLTRYRPVLIAHLIFKKHMNPDRAEDLVHGFIGEKVLTRNLLALADPNKGKFRTFLLTCFDRYVIDSQRKKSPEVIGDFASSAATEPGPDVFDLAWVMQVFVESVRRMRIECARKERVDLWGIFEGRTLGPLFGVSSAPYPLLAERYRLTSEKQAMNRQAIALAMFRRNFQEVIAEYAEDGEVEAEAEHFHVIFSQAGAELVEELRIHLWNSLPEMTMSTFDRERVDVRLLAQLMNLPATPADPGAQLRHLLAAPVPLDLGALGADAACIRAWADSQGLLLKSIGDLFAHPHPLVDLLALVKDFAKENRTDAESPLPREVATVLYYTSIAVALYRCGQRISRHDDTALRQGFQWGIDQAWVDEPVRVLLREGLKCLSSGEEAKG